MVCTKCTLPVLLPCHRHAQASCPHAGIRTIYTRKPRSHDPTRILYIEIHSAFRDVPTRLALARPQASSWPFTLTATLHIYSDTNIIHFPWASHTLSLFTLFEPPVGPFEPRGRAIWDPPHGNHSNSTEYEVPFGQTPSPFPSPTCS